jgi:hypothetical protein
MQDCRPFARQDRSGRLIWTRTSPYAVSEPDGVSMKGRLTSSRWRSSDDIARPPRASHLHALTFALAAATASISSQPAQVFAQVADRLDAQSDANDARNDALLATPNSATPQPPSNLYSTAPGLEQQTPAPQWRFNLLAPLGYNSNAKEINHGGTQTLETSPFGNLSWAAPVADLPLRVTINANAESDRYFRTSDVDRDKFGLSGRLQYVDPTNDQAFSPYVAIAARWDYLPTFSDQISARQDFNLGFNKRFNFDGSLAPVPLAADTSVSTVWSFGLTAFVQRRLREPQLSSSAMFVIPSVSYVISKDWNASVAVEFLGRWFDANNLGFSARGWEVVPIGTVEYVIPTSLFGSETTANMLGRPALDFQGSYTKFWSNSPGGGFDQWTASVTLKMGWRF